MTVMDDVLDFGQEEQQRPEPVPQAPEGPSDLTLVVKAVALLLTHSKHISTALAEMEEEFNAHFKTE